MDQTITMTMTDSQWRRLLEAAEGWDDLGGESQDRVIRSDDMKTAHAVLEAGWKDADEPITAEWLDAVRIPLDAFRISRHISIGHSDDEVAEIFIGHQCDISVETWSEGHEVHVPLPHITTRGQLLALIRLLAPDWKATL